MNWQNDQGGFARWQAPGHSLAIEYSLMVMEELRAAAEEGFQKIPHGGLEIGAILFGQHENGLVRIREWVPMFCEHAKGPGFELSARDRAGLKQLLEACAGDPDLHGLQVVGWCHSHTRSGIWLSPADLEITNTFFPQPWQVALVLRPEKDGLVQAGFFFREPNGQVHTESSYVVFQLAPNPVLSKRPKRDLFRPYVPRRQPGAASVAPPAARPPAGTKPVAPHQTVGAAATAVTPKPAAVAPVALEEPPRRPFRWNVLVVVSCLLVALGLGFQFRGHLFRRAPQPLGLHLEEVENQLVVRWSGTAQPVAEATRGTLEIRDGGEVRQVSLSGAELQAGAVTYQRHSEDVQVRLQVFRDGKLNGEEATRFLGQPLPRRPAEDPQQLLQERDQLQAEAQALQEQLNQERQRTRTLTDSLNALDKRWKVAGQRAPGASR